MSWSSERSKKATREPGLAIAATMDVGPTPDPDLHEAPTRIGRFTVLHQLGAGSMGIVYAAYDSELDRKIAIKLVHGDRGVGYEDRQRRLLREAQAMARLSHPNVVAVHEVGLHRRSVYVAMEFVAGVTLKGWLRAKERPWPEVLKVFIDAGRGLAAAHDAGLIHRDFKPDNVLVGDDGRPRVVDFGLVRPTDSDEDRTGQTLDHDPVLDTRSEVIRLRSSDAGLIVGTPAYMSPEQWRGGELDARSDQFSFCAALFEALFGTLPFPGKTPHAISEAIRAGRILQPPSSSRVPSWLHRVVIRGLSRRPTERWPSMRALLSALGTDPRRKRRLLLGTLAASIALAGFGYAAASVRDPGPTCNSGDELRGVWDHGRRRATREAILASGGRYADELWGRVDTRLSAYADEWTELRTDACLANTQRRESDSLFDLRIRCLDERRQRLAAAVDVLSGEEGSARAVDLVADLPPLGRCADPDALLASVAPPEDPTTAASVAEIRRSLTLAATREAAGQYFEALAITGPLVAEVENLAYPPIVAQTLLRQGSLDMESGQVKEAEGELYESLWIALQAGDEESAGEAIAKWSFVVGVLDGRVDDALALERLALVLAERASASSRLPHLIYNNLGTVTHRKRDYPAARSFYRRALAAGERAPETNPLALAGTLSNLGLSHADEGDYASALPYHRRALETYAEVAGDHHPYFAAALNNSAEASLGIGDLATARREYERALTIFEESLGPTHVHLAYVHLGLGRVALGESDTSGARQHLRSAIELWSRADTTPPELGEALESLATCEIASGRDEAAVDPLRRAVATHGALEPLGARHRRALVALADVLIRTDDHDAARRLISDHVAAPGADALTGPELAELDFALARSVAVAEPARAALLAESALRAYGDDPVYAPQRARIDAWRSEFSDRVSDLSESTHAIQTSKTPTRLERRR
jgi:tetratricopeptide (TPR) repeat protein/tRNA A-37 threonylcarbamoyl transferase component Bud32